MKTEHVSVPGSPNGRDILGGLVPVDLATEQPLRPPMSATPPSPREQFVTMAHDLSCEINSVSAQLDDEQLSVEQAQTAVKNRIATFLSDIGRLGDR